MATMVKSTMRMGLVAVLLLGLILRSGATVEHDVHDDVIHEGEGPPYDDGPDNPESDLAATDAVGEEWWADAPETIGYSADGRWFDSTDEAWVHALAGRSKEQWYNQIRHYWDEQDASNNGVLQGYMHLHGPDVQDSLVLINHTYHELKGAGWLEKHGKDLNVLEVGCGIGRVTQSVLLPHFGKIEALEPSQTMLDKAKELVAADGKDKYNGHSVTAWYHQGVHEFDFGKEKYDVIWVQWVMIYLVQDDFDRILEEIKHSLKPGGIVFVKENVAGKGFVMDTHSNGGSLTRSIYLVEEAFTRAGFEIVFDMSQSDFGDDVYDVHMWALTVHEGTEEEAHEGTHPEL